MINSIKGKIILKNDKFVVIENNGIGYKLSIPFYALAGISENKEYFFWTHLAVRENSLDLYGFEKNEDLMFFEKLIEVSGIGPKSALNIISIAPAEVLKKAISSQDIPYLTKISGIGRKTAEKIVIELKDKFENKEGFNLKEEIEAMEALKSLGYSASEARDALKSVDEKFKNTGQKIKEALKILGSK